MREEKYQPKMPDITEAVFDAGYLIFDLVAAILSFYSKKTPTSKVGDELRLYLLDRAS